MTKGAPLKVPYIDPVSWLDHILQQSPAVHQVYLQKLTEFPPEQAEWRVVIYTDEVTPGNPLKARNKRKVWAVYWSFLELGENLCNELFWYTFLVVRSDEVSSAKKKRKRHAAPTIADGMSQVFREVIKVFVDGTSSLIHGKVMHALGRLLVAKPRVLIGDEPAIKHCIGHKGSAGNKPCLLCRNCVNFRSDLWRHHPELVAHSAHRFESFRAASNASIWSGVNLLNSRKDILTKKEFAELEQSIGLNWTPRSVLWDENLRSVFKPAEMIQYDWMHVFLVQGLFQLEVNLALGRLSSRGFSYERIHPFLIPGRSLSKGVCVRNCFWLLHGPFAKANLRNIYICISLQVV